MQVFDSPSQGSGGFQAVSGVHQEAHTTEIKSHPNGDALSCSSSGCMPVARQLFMSGDVASPSSNSSNHFPEESSQQGSNHSYPEAAFTQLSSADPRANSQPPSQEPQANPQSSPHRFPEGNLVHQLPELSRQTRASSPGTAEQQTGQTASSPDLDSGRHGDSPDLAAGQTANAEAADAEADFLHTLFCCPITKVAWLCSSTYPVLQRVNVSTRQHFCFLSVHQDAKLQMQCQC